MITVERIAPDGTPHRISIREHDLIADMSEASGGRDAGPDPHDLYDSALGACKALTILWYAKRNDIAVEGITVSVSRDASHERTGRYRLNTRVALTGEHDRGAARQTDRGRRALPGPKADDRSDDRDRDGRGVTSLAESRLTPQFTTRVSILSTHSG